MYIWCGTPNFLQFFAVYQVCIVTSHIAIGKRVRVMDVDKQGLWQTFGEGMLSVMSGVPLFFFVQILYYMITVAL